MFAGLAFVVTVIVALLALFGSRLKAAAAADSLHVHPSTMRPSLPFARGPRAGTSRTSIYATTPSANVETPDSEPLPTSYAVAAPERQGQKIDDIGLFPGQMPVAPKPQPEPEEPNWPFLLGRVLDVLMQDYPNFFVAKPRFDIYHDDIELRDDSTIILKGLPAYKLVFQVLRRVPLAVGVLPEVTARYTVDTGMRAVKVRWNMKFNPHSRHPMFLDGISVYKVGRDGQVYEHRLQYVTSSLIKYVQVVPVTQVFLQRRVCVPPMGAKAAENIRAWAKDVLLRAQSLVQQGPDVAQSLVTTARKALQLLPRDDGQGMDVVGGNGEALAVGHFTISRNTNKPTAWEVLTENIPPKLCTNKFDCEYKRGARCCDFLFVWSCCYPNNEDWPPSGGIGIPIADPIPIPVSERDPRMPQAEHHRRLASDAAEEAELVSHYHKSPLADFAAWLETAEQCPL
jgi:hypothetical protein